MEEKFHMLIGGHVCYTTNLFIYYSINLQKWFRKVGSETDDLTSDFLEFLLFEMIDPWIRNPLFISSGWVQFLLQLMFYLLLIRLWLFGCCLSDTTKVDLELWLSCCSTHTSPVDMGVHCKIHWTNLRFSDLVGFCCLLFVHFSHHRGWTYLFSKHALLLIQLHWCIVLCIEGQNRVI